jgi:hypothetical protein
MVQIWRRVGTFDSFEKADERRSYLKKKNPGTLYKIHKYGRSEDANLRFIVKESQGSCPGKENENAEDSLNDEPVDNN